MDTETTETTETERVVVIPEVTVPVTSQQARARVLELVEELRPMLEELHAEAIKVRADSDAVLVALWPTLSTGRGELTDEMCELAAKATGWGEVWDACVWIGDLFGHDLAGEFDTIGLATHEIARGGERDFPPGTVSTLVKPGVDPITVKVEFRPSDASNGLYAVREVNTGQPYSATHVDLKAGLVSVPGEDGKDGGDSTAN